MNLNKKYFLSIILFSVLLFGGLSSGSIGSTKIQLNGISVVINEIHYNPGPVDSDADYEFAELHNNGTSGVDLTGWTFETVSLDGITIAAGGYVIIAQNGLTYSGLASATCSVIDVGGYFGLSNGGNTLDLLDGATPMDSVTYDDFDPWPTAPDGAGPSLERIDPKFATSNVTNWGASIVAGGSPCAQSSIHFSVDTVPVIESHTHRSWTPTAGSDVTFSVKATDNKAVSSVTVDVTSDDFATNTTLNLLDGDSDDVYEALFTVGNTGTAYTYGVTVEDDAGQIVQEWNNLMNFTVADVYPFISGISPVGANVEFITLSFDGRGSASSYDLSGHEIVVGGEYLGSLGSFDAVFQFPGGSSIQHGETIILTQNGTEFEAVFGLVADFEFNGTSAATDMITLEFGGSLTGFGIYNGADEVLLVSSGSVLDAVLYGDFSTPIFRGDTGLSVANLPSASSQYGLATRDNDDPLNDFQALFFPYVRPNNLLNSSQVTPGALVELDIFDKDNVSRVFFSWNGGANTTETAPYTTNVPSTIGTHTLTVFANDSSGFYNILSYVYVASDAPVFNLISPANNAIIPSAATVTVSIADTDGMGTVNYNWDGATNTPLTIEQDNTYEITGPSTDGAHTLNVLASDINGTTGSAVYTFTVDGTNPLLTLNTPANNTSVDEGTVVDLDVTDTNLASVSISVNDAASTALASPYDHTLVTTGSVKLEIVATDEAGNTATLLLIYTVIADEPPTTSTPPPTTTSSTPADTDDGDDGFIPGFTALYTLIAILSLVQIVKIKRSRR